jgi:hypothetical protein
MEAHLTARQKQSRVRIRSAPAHGKLCQSLAGSPPRMAQYHVLVSDGMYKCKKYTEILIIYRGKNSYPHSVTFYEGDLMPFC